MRVPPYQSRTVLPMRSSARSTSRSRSMRVMLVRRVPKTKVCTRSAALVRAWKKWRRMREYDSIEPEMSQSATMVGGRVPVDLRSRGSGQPPVRTLVRRVRRRSIRRPRGSGR